MRGTQIEVVDLPLGDILGGGLTLTYDREADRLVVIRQRGDWEPLGATTFTRIDSRASPDSSLSASASP